MTKKVPIPFPQRASAFVRGPLIGLSWLGVIFLCLVLLGDRPQDFEYRGWVPTTEYPVTAGTTGKLGAVLVEPFQEVKKGQLVAQLDARPLEARLATAGAELLRLRAQIEDAQDQAAATQALAQAEADLESASDMDSLVMRWEGDLHRSFFDESQLRLNLLERGVELAVGRIQSDLLAAQQQRAEALSLDGAGPQAASTDLALQVAQAQETNRLRVEQIAAIRHELELAQERRAKVRNALDLRTGVDPLPVLPAATQALEAAIRVQSLVLAELELEREALRLSAPIDGQVTALYVGEGQSLLAGSEVMLVTSREVSEAIVFVPPSVALGKNLVGRVVELRTGELPGRTFESQVVGRSPKVELLPERLWSGPGLPAYGMALRVPVGRQDVFGPGEILTARIIP